MILYGEYRNVDDLNKIVKKYGFVVLEQREANYDFYFPKDVYSDDIDEALVCLYDGKIPVPGKYSYNVHSFAVLRDNHFEAVKLDKVQRRYLNDHKGVILWEFIEM